MEELSEFLSQTNIPDSITAPNADVALTTSQTTAKPSAIKSDKDVSISSTTHQLYDAFYTLAGSRFKF